MGEVEAARRQAGGGTLGSLWGTGIPNPQGKDGSAVLIGG